MNPLLNNTAFANHHPCAMRDYTILIDKSGSMAKTDMNGRSRWEAAKETIEALALKVFEFDPDGIDVWPFSSTNTCYRNVRPEKVEQIFQENEPCGGTAMAEVLKNALDKYFEKRDAGHSKPKGEMIFVVTDGEPDNQDAVIETLSRASSRLHPEDNLSIQFIQIGHDASAARFLERLDEVLVSDRKASYDFVKTIKIGDMERQGLTQTILNLVHETAKSKNENENKRQWW